MRSESPETAGRRNSGAFAPGWCARICLLLLCALLAGCTEQAATSVSTAQPAPSPSVALIITPTTGAQSTATAAATATRPEQGAAAIAGAWIGGYQLPGDPAMEQRVTLTFTETAGPLRGEITNPLTQASEPLSVVTRDGEKLRFEWLPQSPGAAAVLSFDGRVVGRTITGTVRRGADSSSFAFAPLAAQPLSAYAQFAGTYRFESGRAIGFYETAYPDSQVFVTRLLYADLQSGDLGAAFPISTTGFVVGPAVGLAFPARGEVNFSRDAAGAVSGLTWSRAGAPPQVAHKVSFDIAEVSYPSDDITLAGQLVMPQTPGKHPAVVIIQGAGAVGRKNWLFDMLGGMFGVQGIATLSYDKRGVGDSGGSYIERGNASQQNLARLARDARAGVAYLQGRADIDSAQIGMQGNSQAGWIIPLAAESGDVAFMVLWSGPIVSQGISDLYDRLAEGTSRDELTRLLHDTTPSGFDPLPYLEKGATPGLWAFGSSDMTVPVQESVARLESVAGGHDFTWRVFPNGDHFLFDVARQDGGLVASRGYVSGLLDQTITWVRQHVRSN